MRSVRASGMIVSGAEFENSSMHLYISTNVGTHIKQEA